ncbi:MAG: PH domain-containing protein [Chloroflexi bacterium]|nr:PH domain-containing protein [Chloroflexota bacterium]
MSYLEKLLGENERIVLVTRHHWLTMGGTVFWALILALAVLVASILLGLAVGALGLLLLLLLILPLLVVLRDWIKWRNEMYAVTNLRVLQLEGVLNKRVSDSSLEKVNDVVMKQSFWGRVFDFGDVEIMTASEIGVNKLSMIAHPVRFKTTMVNQKEGLGEVEAFESRARGVLSREPGAEALDAPQMIEELAALRDKGLITADEFQRKKAELLSRM